VADAMTSRDNLRVTVNRHACYFALSATGLKFVFLSSVAKNTSGRYGKQTTEGVALLLVSVLCESIFMCFV
jgi:hypothetical protein